MCKFYHALQTNSKNKKALETAMVSLQIHLVVYIRSHGH